MKNIYYICKMNNNFKNSELFIIGSLVEILLEENILYFEVDNQLDVKIPVCLN